MYAFEKSVFINLPQKNVFEYITNPANNPHWQRTTVSAYWITNGPPGIGSKFKSVIKMLGMPIEGEVVVTNWEPFTEFGFKGSGGSIGMAGNIHFEPKGTGTQVTLNGKIIGTGFIKLFEGMLGRQAEKQDASNYDALKLLLEAN
jgi:carbon monoxide dehydrogenase subunit G